MGLFDIPATVNFLESLPLNKIAKYSGDYKNNAIPFSGCPKQHLTDKNKLILVYDPLGNASAVLEFKLDDILYVEEVPQVVTEKGEGIPMIKLWIRRGTHGMLFQPFEVDETINFIEVRQTLKDRISKKK